MAEKNKHNYDESKIKTLSSLEHIRLRTGMYFRADRKLQERIEDLAGKSTEGQLTESEKAEYAGYVRANKFVAVLQRQARQLVSSRS